eukprot:scaffold212264_cov10-Tisochrysis_lutea.AAC.1
MRIWSIAGSTQSMAVSVICAQHCRDATAAQKQQLLQDEQQQQPSQRQEHAPHPRVSIHQCQEALALLSV